MLTEGGTTDEGADVIFLMMLPAQTVGGASDGADIIMQFHVGESIIAARSPRASIHPCMRRPPAMQHFIRVCMRAAALLCMHRSAAQHRIDRGAATCTHSAGWLAGKSA